MSKIINYIEKVGYSLCPTCGVNFSALLCMAKEQDAEIAALRAELTVVQNSFDVSKKRMSSRDKKIQALISRITYLEKEIENGRRNEG